MSNSPNLSMPFLAAGQAQKHVTLNEALRILDTLVQGAAVSRTLGTPPAAPLDGQLYVIHTSANGIWAGKANQLASYQDNGWVYFTPKEGWIVWVCDENQLCVYAGSAWESVNGSVSAFPVMGVNATADTTNRLSVSAPATLLNHAGNGHQLKLNKAQTTDTASVLFQNGFSGRAEIGLQGSDSFGAKVSANGTNWVDGFALTPAGDLGIGTTQPQSAMHVERNKSVLTMVETDITTPTGAGMSCFTQKLPSLGGERLGFASYGSRGGAALSLSAAGFGAYAEAAWTSGTSHPTYLRFETTGANEAVPSERMRIAANGNIGIGMTSPMAKLQVNGAVRVGAYTLTTLPSASGNGVGSMIYVINAVGGPVIAFSDGTNWRKVTDRLLVSQ
jgi:Protein of unknown function (DUF2793)